VKEVCDRFTVLRDGRWVGDGRVAETTVPEIIRLMVGRAVDSLFQRRAAGAAGEVALEVAGLTRRGDAQDPHATVLDNVSLTARRGEILGLAGLMGAGRTELARAIFGADPFDAGEVRIDGAPAAIRTPRDAIRHGLGLVPEDRKQQALFLALAVNTNISLAALGDLLRWGSFVDEKAERALVERYRQMLNIRMASADQLVANLSGGNQQKVVLARWLALKPKVLIVDEPTRGIDVAAKVEVHHLLFELAEAGIAVIAISSELPEVLAISDRIVTMCEGRVTGEVAAAGATQEMLMAMMTDRARRAA
jgi:inositol transport system ATP-binding protein